MSRAWLDLHWTTGYIFIGSPHSGQYSLPTGGHASADLCCGFFIGWSGGRIVAYCTWMIISSHNVMIWCLFQRRCYVSCVRYAKYPYLGQSVNLAALYNGLGGIFTWCLVTLKSLKEKLASYSDIFLKWNVHHEPRDGTLRNSLGSQCGSHNYGPICGFGFDIGIQTFMLSQRRISALTMVTGIFWFRVSMRTWHFDRGQREQQFQLVEPFFPCDINLFRAYRTFKL